MMRAHGRRAVSSGAAASGAERLSGPVTSAVRRVAQRPPGLRQGGQVSVGLAA